MEFVLRTLIGWQDIDRHLYRRLVQPAVIIGGKDLEDVRTIAHTGDRSALSSR